MLFIPKSTAIYALLLLCSTSPLAAQFGDPPQGVVVGPGGEPLTVEVSWDTVDGADRYSVVFTIVKGDGQEGLCSMSTHMASVTVNAISREGRVTASIPVGANVNPSVTNMLRAYSTYTVVVVAESDTLGVSNPSTTVVYTTQQTAASTTPIDVKVTTLNSTAIYVTWGRIDICRTGNGLIVGYRVQYRAETESSVQSVDRPGARDNGGNVYIAGLTPFTVYYVQVAAVNEIGDVGVFSNPKAVLTAEDVPGPVASLTAVPSFFTVFYTWRGPLAPNGIITTYSIQYTSTNTQGSSTVSGSQRCFRTPDSYNMGSEVNLTVVAFTAVGPGAPTTITAHTLTRPSAVEARVAVAQSDTSASVYWNSLTIPDTDIDNYTIVYSPVTSNNPQEATVEMRAVFPGSYTSANITGLIPGLGYQFQVFATVTLAGEVLEGERSVPLLVNMTGAPAGGRDPGEPECADSSSSSSAVVYGTAFSVSGVIIGLIGGALSAAFLTYKVIRAFSDDRRYEKVSVSRNIHSKMSKLPFSPSVIELERGRDCASRDLGDSQTNESTDDLIYNSAYNESSSRNEEQEDNPVYSDPVEILPAYDDPAKHEEQEDNPVYYNDPATNEELEATPAYDDPGRQATPAHTDPARLEELNDNPACGGHVENDYYDNLVDNPAYGVTSIEEMYNTPVAADEDIQ